jgi:hypothetical protein
MRALVQKLVDEAGDAARAALCCPRVTISRAVPDVRGRARQVVISCAAAAA